ncbi:ABC transporter permease subunit, partial [Paraburkholderia sp. SIMBA_009]
PLALSMYTGFAGVPATLKMAGRNYGLSGLRQIALILVPAALPSIFTGLYLALIYSWLATRGAEYLLVAGSGIGNPLIDG